jgi:hypothetical protein
LVAVVDAALLRQRKMLRRLRKDLKNAQQLRNAQRCRALRLAAGCAVLVE